MKRIDIKKAYCYDSKLSEAILDFIGEDDFRLLGVYTPLYFIDFGYGTYTQINTIDSVDIPTEESIIVQYYYNDNTDSDTFRILRYIDAKNPILTMPIYSGRPRYDVDDAGNVYFPPQSKIVALNERLESPFFENLMLSIILKDRDFKKKFS